MTATTVLIHGGSYTGGCWDRVLPHLDGDVVVVDLPGRGRRPGDVGSVTLEDNVAATIEDIDAAGADQVLLVGHSIGGITVAHVANELGDRVVGAVLVACTIPPHGSAVVDHIDPDVRESVLAGSGGGVFRIDEPTAREILCNDLDEEQSEWALEGMVDETTSILGATVDLTALRSGLPVTYVRTALDQTLPPVQQDAAIAALDDPEVVDVESGHLVMISQPERLAEIIAGAARR